MGLFKQVKKLVKQAAPTLGAAIGFMAGGPAGAAVGSGIGSLAAGKDVSESLRNAAFAYAGGSLAKGFGVSPNTNFAWSQPSTWLPTYAKPASGLFSMSNAFGAPVQEGAMSTATGIVGAAPWWNNPAVIGGGLYAASQMSQQPEEVVDEGPYLSSVDQYYAAKKRGENPDPADFGLEPPPQSDLLQGLTPNLGTVKTATETAKELADLGGSNVGLLEGIPTYYYGLTGGSPYNLTSLAGGGLVDPSGPGGPTDDKMLARVSPGEYMFTNEEVTNLGEGNHTLGAARMYALANQLRGMA